MEFKPAFVRFQNNTCYCVEILWIHINKTEKSYGILPPKSFLDVNTYTAHPWIFREYMSKSQMVVAGNKVFTARSWIEEYKRLDFKHPVNVPLRTIVLIEMPVLELRQQCLLTLANILKTKDDIIMLEIPATLQKELIQMMKNKEKIKLINY